MRYLKEKDEEIPQDLIGIMFEYVDILKNSMRQLGTRLAEAEEELNSIQIVKE